MTRNSFGRGGILSSFFAVIPALLGAGAAIIAMVLAAPPLLAQTITVGTNIHVSSDEPTTYHRELWAGADLAIPTD